MLPAGFPPPPKYAPPKGYEHLEERVPLRGIRRTIAQGLWQSHLYTVRTLNVDEADLTELVRLRERLKPQAEAQGVKLTYLPFIVKAVVRALKKFPMLNTSLDEERQEIVYKRYYHIGLAVATERGLIVPRGAGCGPEERLGARPGDRRALPEGAGRPPRPGGGYGVHLHHHQHRLRGGHLELPHHPPAGRGHPRRALHKEAPLGHAGRLHKAAGHHVPLPLL